MNKTDWKRKLSSRKFWAAIAGAVASFGAAFSIPDNTIAVIVGVLGGVGSICAYIFAEATTDVANINSTYNVTVEVPKEDEAESEVIADDETF